MDMPMGGDLPHRFWTCGACDSQNSDLDGECQFCECTGVGCARDTCSGADHERDAARDARATGPGPGAPDRGREDMPEGERERMAGL